MITLYDTENGKALGEITEKQLQFLIDQLEEESPADTDYYVNRAMVFFLKERGADDDLVNKLYEMLGDRDEMEVRWDRKK